MKFYIQNNAAPYNVFMCFEKEDIHLPSSIKWTMGLNGSD